MLWITATLVPFFSLKLFTFWTPLKVCQTISYVSMYVQLSLHYFDAEQTLEQASSGVIRGVCLFFNVKIYRWIDTGHSLLISSV